MTVRNIDYCAVDFDTLVAQLNERVKALPAWKDTYRSSTGQAYIEMLAFVESLMFYYLARRVNESYMSTARNRTSVVNLAKLVGYRPHRVVSATGVIRFSVPEAPGVNLVIPKWTKLSRQTDTGSIGYVTSVAAVLPSDQTYVDVPVIQGTVTDAEPFRSTGDEWQQFELADTDIEQSSISVAVQEVEGGEFVPWTRLLNHRNFNDLGKVVQYVRQLLADSDEAEAAQLLTWLQSTQPDFYAGAESFLAASTTDRIWIESQSFDGKTWVEFGNSLTGMIPPNIGTSNIRVQYLRSLGSGGNVSAVDVEGQDSMFQLLDTILTAGDQPSPQTVSVRSLTPFQGGSDEEETESIRSNAPALFAAGDRLVTRADYQAYLSSYPGVSSASVWGEAELWQDGETVSLEDMNRVQIALLLRDSTATPVPDYAAPGQSFLDTLTERLRERSVMTVRYDYLEVTPVDVEVVVSLAVLPGYSIPDVQAAVREAVLAQFVIGDTLQVGTSKRISDIVSAVDGTDGVDYCHVSLRCIQDMVHTGAGVFTFNNSSNDASALLPFKTGTVGLRVSGNDLQGVNGRFVDNGNGSLAGIVTGNYTISSGLVSYGYGTAVVTLELGGSPVTSDVQIVYEQDADGDLVVGRDQVLRLSGEGVIFES